MNTKYQSQPTQTMREFFSREDVLELQEIQKRNHPDTQAHKDATKAIETLAAEIGASKFLGNLETPTPRGERNI
jgi:hypothetical protein